METNGTTIAGKRLAALFDGGSFTELDALRTERDGKTAVLCAHGYVDGQPCYAFSQSAELSDGAMGRAAAGKILRVMHLAAKTGTPLVGIYDANGVYVDGTADSLSFYGKLIANAANLSGVVPMISVVAGVCAGSAALLAATADFLIMTESAELYLTPPFGTDAAKAETAAKAGLAAAVCADDAAAMETVKALLTKLPANNLAGAPVCEYAEPNGQGGCLCKQITDADSQLPLYKAFGTSVGTALATVKGLTVGIVNTARSEDALSVDDCTKIARFVRTCDAFSIPVITIVDTVGFKADNEAARLGSLRAMTSLCGAYAEATTIKIALITGEAAGAAFSAIAGRGAGTDYVIAWDSASISPLRAEAAVEFLWHDKLKGAENADAKRAELAKEYQATLASAQKAAELGVVDQVIAKGESRIAIETALDLLEGKRVSGNPKKHSNIPF